MEQTNRTREEMVTDVTSAGASALTRSELSDPQKGTRMLSKRVDAFEDAAMGEAVRREAQYERARELLDEQADSLMETEPPGESIATEEARHAPHNPHRRPLSSAARRLMRAHEQVEEGAQD